MEINKINLDGTEYELSGAGGGSKLYRHIVYVTATNEERCIIEIEVYTSSNDSIDTFDKLFNIGSTFYGIVTYSATGDNGVPKEYVTSNGIFTFQGGSTSQVLKFNYFDTVDNLLMVNTKTNAFYMGGTFTIEDNTITEV